ncbi:MAG: 2-hydroxymuconate tautomerase [Candidatus Saccharicenans sp.]
MPLVEIHLLEGRTKEQKKAMLEAVTQAIHQTLGAPLETIRVWIQEIPKDEFMSAGLLASEREKKNK